MNKNQKMIDESVIRGLGLRPIFIDGDVKSEDVGLEDAELDEDEDTDQEN